MSTSPPVSWLVPDSWKSFLVVMPTNPSAPQISQTWRPCSLPLPGLGSALPSWFRVVDGLGKYIPRARQLRASSLQQSREGRAEVGSKRAGRGSRLRVKLSCGPDQSLTQQMSLFELLTHSCVYCNGTQAQHTIFRMGSVQ